MNTENQKNRKPWIIKDSLVPAAFTCLPGAILALLIALTSQANAQTAPATNTPPNISSGSPAILHPENDDTPLPTYTATDDEGDAITWTVSGVDADFFTIDPTSGLLAFRTPLDFENPVDENRDNRYLITVIATDNGIPNESSTVSVVININNANDPGTISPITGISQVGETLTAGTVTDPDRGRVAVTSYEWQRSPADSDAYVRIVNTGSTYTLRGTDLGNTIRVIATYTDLFTTGNTVTSAPTPLAIAPATAPVPPSIALRQDTGPSQIDRYTRNGQVDVTDLATNATWTYSINGGTDFTIGSGSSFTLPEGAYTTNTVLVVQTVSSIDSAPAILAPVTVDTTAPVINLNGPATITLTVGDTYTELATIQENLDPNIKFTRINGNTVDTTTIGTYRIRYNTIDAAGHAAMQMIRTVIIVPPPVKIAHLDGKKSSVSINDAKFLYYAHALNLVPESTDLPSILGPLTSAEDSELGNLLIAAQDLLTDLTGNGDTDIDDAAVFYYSFALEASLGNGDTEPGILEIKKAILGPLAATNDITGINQMLQRIHILREE